MSRSHGKKTVILIRAAGGAGTATDISTHANASELTLGGDSHDLTGYGVDDHVVGPGLGTGGYTMSGHYDTSETDGPAAVLRPLVNTMVEITRRVEGTGVGLPQDVFEAHLEEYVESSPVADYVTWTASLTKSGPVDDTPQEGA